MDASQSQGPVAEEVIDKGLIKEAEGSNQQSQWAHSHCYGGNYEIVKHVQQQHGDNGHDALGMYVLGRILGYTY